ncbi:MAG TPA: rod shape-determining protein MreD [Acidimicrobiales bacterium]|nr:rod shape-determining protein MreD [Acidimicrobiales bacterium]
MTTDPRFRVPLVILTALLVQVTLLSRLRLFGVVPNLMLLVAVAGGITGGPVRGAVIGFASGLAIDIFLETPLGLSALVFSIVGYTVGAVETGILRAAWWIPVLTAFGACAAGEALFAVAAQVVGRPDLLSARLAIIVVIVGITSAMLALPVVRVVGWSLLKNTPRRTTVFS